MALDYLPSPSWAVIYGETPSATRWSELGTNDDALATAAGIDDLAILTRHLNLGAVIPEKLDLSTIGIIASNSVTGNFTTTTDVQSLTMTIPTGCTSVLILGMIRLQAQNAALQDMQAWVDYNSTTAITKTGIFTSSSSFQGASVAIADKIAVTAGSRVFKIRAATSGGGLMNCGVRSVLIIPVKA